MNNKIGNLFKGDKVIWMVFFFLCMISIVEVFSASSNLTYKSQNYVGPIAFHAVTIFIGAVMAVVTLNIPCRYFKLMTPFLLIITAITLLWVLVGGESINGANRVISLPGGITFQPSEIAKGTMVLITAQILSAMQREDGADKKAFKYILCILIPTVILIGIENLSTAALLFAVIFLTPPKHEENMAIAYVDGKMITNQAQAMQMGQEALQEIFSNGSEEEQLTDLFNAK